MIVLADALRLRIAQAAEAAYPEECCGLLVGRRRAEGPILVEAVEPSPNVAADRRAGFEVDPALRLRLQRTLRAEGRAIVGLYHSHPDGPAEPSARDLESAWEPELAWLIVGMAQGRATRTAAFALLQDQPPRFVAIAILAAAPGAPDAASAPHPAPPDAASAAKRRP